MSVKYNTPAEIAENSSLTPYQADILHKAANLVSNLTKFKQIIPKLKEVTADSITREILVDKIENKELGDKLKLKKVE